MMMWNPPWTLTFVMPLGAMPFRLARGIWMLSQLAITLGSAVALWRHYRGPPAGEPVVVVLACLFAPLLLSLKYGQISPLVLLGVVGFLIALRHRRDTLAGAFLVLVSVKPHLVYAVWPAVLVWTAWSGRWRVLAGLAIAGLIAVALPAAVNPDVYNQYHQLTTNPPPSGENFRNIHEWESPTFGWQLRLIFGKEHFWLQYVPPAIGVVWVGWYLRRKLRRWDWDEAMPVLLLVSVCAAAYGAWPADSLVLLPAVVAAAANLAVDPNSRRIRLGGIAFLGLGILTLLIERGPTTEPYVWVPPLYLAAYLFSAAAASSFPGSRSKTRRK
jgi:hypothetical protein